jgi:excisionase family DNA binding protein
MLRLRPIVNSLRPKTLLPLADLALVNVAVLTGLWLWTVRDHFRVFNADFVLARGNWFLAISAVWLALAVSQEFYRRRGQLEPVASLASLLTITLLSLILYFALYFFAPRDNTLPRGVVLSIAAVSFVLVGGWRLAYIAVTSGLSHDQILALLKRWGQGTAEEAARHGRDSLEEEVLTVQEVADHLKVSQATVWRWCKSGKVPAFRVGQQWRIRASDLQLIMEDNGRDKDTVHR